ncbi:thioredoxin family protein, partial [bacterium LRH843]|nr:thioredoxin family protein [bacterium LRH843]
KVEELSKEFPDVVFLKVDIDECDDMATEYDVQSMPTFIFIKNSAKIDGFSGANYDKLKETVQKLK